MTFTIEKGSAVAVCSTKGGELISFRHDGTEYVWQGDAKYWSGQAPCLFPIVCRAKEDRVILDGVSYPMPKHGIARKVEYTPAKVAPDTVVFTLQQSEDSKKAYPYDFTLEIIHKVTEDGFSTTYRVINTDTKEMLFCIGGHPGFNCPLQEEERFSDYSICFADATGAMVRITEPGSGYMDPSASALDLIQNNELPLRYSDYDDDAIIVENLPKKSLKLINRNTGRGIQFDFASFDAIGFWTPVKMEAPFICLEPWNGLPGGLDESPNFSDKKYVKVLQPGALFETGYQVRVLPAVK